MENTTTEVLAHDGDFWLQDGSIVLVAKKTAFKVYKGVLSAHSPIFADMFSSATHADEVCDGCPVVRVSDSPEDLKWLLTYLIPKTFSHLEGRYRPEYPELSALARLGHKYEIDALEHYAITCLKHVFTSSSTERKWIFYPSNYVWSPNYSSYNPIDIVDIARLTGNPSMLPLAFFLCIQREHIIIDGLAREDGTHLVLDKADVKRCISAFRDIYRTSERAMLQAPLATSPSCSTPTACRNTLNSAFDRTSQSRSIYLLEDFGDEGTPGLGCWLNCTPCREAILEFRRNQRRELWKKLPEIFGLQDELKGHWPG